MTSINLADPHVFALGSLDVTETVNGMLIDALTADGDDPLDGLLDLSVVIVFDPLDPDAASSPAEIVFADCTAPLADTTCSRTATSTVLPGTATNGDAACMAPTDGTTSGYAPPVGVPGGRCFATTSADFDLALGDITIPLLDGRVAARYAGDQLVEGLVAGFLTQAAAEATVVPADIPVVGGQPVASLLKAADMDTGPGGEAGWYFYLNYTAETVPYQR